MQIASNLAAASLALLLLLAGLLLLDARKRSSPFLLGYLLIITLLTVLRFSFFEGGPLLIALPYVLFPAVFLAGPLLYLYARSVLFTQTLRPLEIAGLALAPLASLCVHIIMNLKFPETLDPAAIQNQSGALGPYTRALGLAGCLYNGVFEWRGLRLLGAYRRAVVHEYAGPVREQLTWLACLLWANLVLLVVYLAANLLAWHSGAAPYPVTPAEGIVALAMSYLIVFYYVRKPAIFAIAPPESESESESESEPESGPAAATPSKYARQNLSETARKAMLATIKAYMQREKPYLEDDLSLNGLAAALDLPAHHVSMTINIETNQNFFQFVNGYRVEEAKSLLLAPKWQAAPVLRIAYEAGFQSKAAFNRVFKELAGETPSAYRARRLAQALQAAPHPGAGVGAGDT